MSELARPESEPKTALGSRLREIRKRVGDLDRADFAKRLGIPVSTLGNYERGLTKPDTDALAAYNEKCGVSMHWIVTGQGEMFDDPTVALSQAPELQAVLMKKMARLVTKVHDAAGITLRPEDVAAEATDLYNELVRRVENLGDTDEVEAVFPQLEVRLKKRVAAATREPGTGKRQAS